ncbi:MAG: flippase-like domain-containing protein [Alphaproteobacteria bacterium]|nr:flippase-like domain-containing protein [Alphaproteobacteria bacterium]
MKSLPLAIAVFGVAVMVALVAYFGAGAVVGSLLAIGVPGFAAICVIHLGLTAVMGLAWWSLLPGAPPGWVMWARLVRDSGAEALPLSQVGGYVLGGRAVSLGGVSGTRAAASTIVDVTLEFMAQLAYTALGLAWLVRLQPETEVAVPVLIGLGVAVMAAIAFVVAQRRGLNYIDRIARILGEGWVEKTAAGAAALHAALADIYARRGGLWASFCLHLICWIASAIEIWLALHLAGQPLSFGAVLAIESLLYAIRTAAFVVPQAVGVQEGAYILLGAGFGLTPEMSLALSLLKRARDLTIGLPAIGVWQFIESGRVWRRRKAQLQVAAIKMRSRD